jgi:thiaminase
LPNKKKGAALLSIKETHNIALIVCCLILGNWGCGRQYSNHAYQQDTAEPGLFERAGHYLEDENYTSAYKLYTYFVANHPHHPLTDDAAYRICYMHVIASDKNPYLNYKDAQKQFQKFIETYKNSRYITAVKNWLTIIDTMGENDSRRVQANQNDAIELRNAQARMAQLEDENKKLKTMLQELQQAIER